MRDIATLLCIRYPFLEAIEEGRYNELPGSAYAIGFVRTYAEHLGLDSTEVVRRFKAETENLERRTALVFPTPVAERSTPGGGIVFVGILVAAIAYGAWYVGTSKNSFLVDLVSPLPSRLAALVHGDGDEAGATASESKAAPVQPLVAEAGSPGSPEAASTDRPAAAAETASTPAAPETQTATTPAEPPAPVATPAATSATRTEPVDTGSRAVLSPPKPVPPVVKAAPAKPVAVPRPVPAPAVLSPAPSTPATTAPAVTAAVPTAPSTVRSEPTVAKPPATSTESGSAASADQIPASPSQVMTAVPAGPARRAPSATSEQPAAVAETPAPTATSPAPAAADTQIASAPPTHGAVPAASSPAPKPVTPAVSATQPAASAPEAPKPPQSPAVPMAATQPAKPATPPVVETPRAPVEQVAAIPAAPEMTPPAAPQGQPTGGVTKASRIVVRAKLDSWIQVRDGVARRLLVTRLLRAGDTYRVPDQAGLSLLTGNAGALEIIVDGEPVPPIGDVGVVRRDVALDADKLKAGAAVVD